MKIRAPDDVEGVEDSNKTSNKLIKEPALPNFADEIKEMLKLPKVPSKFVVEGVDGSSPEFKLQVLLKFTGLCREEIIPRHVMVIQALESKSNKLQCQLVCQQKDLANVMMCKQELRESVERLEAARKVAQARHEDLAERLKEALQNSQDRCKNKTLAEIKMYHDLIEFKTKAENLKVNITETESKMNYYTKQVQTQTDEVKRHMKPLYLDSKRAAFMKANLNNMRQNIEELVRRVKTLKSQTSELEQSNSSQNLSKVSGKK